MLEGFGSILKIIWAYFKVCLNISPQWVCEDCQDLVFTGGSWQIVHITTHVNEIYQIPHSGKIYDLLGRELTKAPIGKLYIRNRQLYINK